MKSGGGCTALVGPGFPSAAIGSQLFGRPRPLVLDDRHRATQIAIEHHVTVGHSFETFVVDNESVLVVGDGADGFVVGVPSEDDAARVGVDDVGSASVR
ncbi:hypothetical protein [Nocardia sp. NPDC046763]|uniref:hypothetical protein n=1 Tax=Nocardia sp. NPDC046763 TaxID=3155256 RepID=UPI0033CF7C84